MKSLASHDRKVLLKTLQNYATGPSNDGRIVEQFFNCLDTDVSRKACDLFKDGDHVGLLNLDIDPVSYAEDQGDLFHRDYLAISFLSKNDSLKTGIDKKEKALAKFRLMEEQCRVTNHRFKSYSELENSEYALLLFAMRRKIDLVLGDFDIEEFFDKSSWGPGSTTLISGSDVSGARKYQSETGITRSAYALLGSSLAAAYPGWFREEQLADSSVTIQEGNKIITVPKNSKIDRVIAVEPGLNLFFQKGIGKMIKSRLRRFGVDLTTQTRNQALALVGSLTGDLATVDFSSASDSIAWAVVHKLLPERWFTVLNSLRCKSGVLGGESVEWEKFSSMGNGFTFELESLIFWAAAVAVCDERSESTEDISVFGDDVIIPTSVFPRYEEFTRFLGFTVNGQKSYSSGHFRESCGAHYFKGLDVKPIYHKKELTDAFSVYKLANSVRILAHRRNFNCGCDVRFLGTWRRILQGLPSALRSIKIPYGYGDGGVASNLDEASPDRLMNGLEGYSAISASLRSVQIEHTYSGLLQQRLRQVGIGTLTGTVKRHELMRDCAGLSNQGYGNNSDLRGHVTIRVTPLVIPSWYNFGAWE
jgi:hypothetical protein